MHNCKHDFGGSSGRAGKVVGAGIMGAVAAAAVTYYLFGTEKGAAKLDKIKEKFSGMKEDMKDKVCEMCGE